MKAEDISDGGTTTIPTKEYFNLLKLKSEYMTVVANKFVFRFNDREQFRHYYGLYRDMSDVLDEMGLRCGNDMVEVPVNLIKDLEEINHTNIELYKKKMEEIHKKEIDVLNEKEQLKSEIYSAAIAKYLAYNTNKKNKWFTIKSTLDDELERFYKLLDIESKERGLK